MGSTAASVPPEVSHNAAFRNFIDKLGKEQARDLVREINGFMKEFRKDDPNPNADSTKLQSFLSHMEGRIASHPLFSSCTPHQLEEAVEGMEKYLTTKMFDRLFGMSQEELERDAELATRFQALQFVKLEHLEITPGLISDAALVHAISSLKEINAHKAPRDKLQCVLRCCAFINNLLLSNSGSDFGADDFTPVLIYVVIRAQPEKLASNLSYIERFRMQARLVGEAQYYFTQLYGAAAFIETMDASSLKVDPDEFLAHMLAHGAMAEELLQSGTPPHRGARPTPFHADASTQQAAAQVPGTQGGALPPSQELQSTTAVAAAMRAARRTSGAHRLPPTRPPKTAAELEADGLPLLLQAEADGHLRARHRYLYATVNDLTVRDVQQLLGDYKELVLRFEALSLAADNESASAQLARISTTSELTVAPTLHSSRNHSDDTAAPVAATIPSAAPAPPPAPPSPAPATTPVSTSSAPAPPTQPPGSDTSAASFGPSTATPQPVVIRGFDLPSESASRSPRSAPPAASRGLTLQTPNPTDAILFSTPLLSPISTTSGPPSPFPQATPPTTTPTPTQHPAATPISAPPLNEPPFTIAPSLLDTPPSAPSAPASSAPSAASGSGAAQSVPPAASSTQPGTDVLDLLGGPPLPQQPPALAQGASPPPKDPSGASSIVATGGQALADAGDLLGSLVSGLVSGQGWGQAAAVGTAQAPSGSSAEAGGKQSSTSATDSLI